MTDATTEFFEKLARRGHEPLLAKVTGTMRFDLVQGTRTGHSFGAVNHGAVALSAEDVEADCVVCAERTLFAGIASGEENVMAAVVHDHVRPRQHLHQPAGGAIHAGVGSNDPARARSGNGRGVGWTASATRSSLP